MNEFLTSKQLADRWGMHEKSLARWRVEGKGPPFMKLGGGKTSAVYYRTKDVLKWEKKHRVSGND